MKKWMLLGMLTLSFGCSDDPIMEDLTGEYGLERVEGNALPFAVDAVGVEGCWWRLVDGSLTVGYEDQFTLGYREQVGCGGTGGETAPRFFAGHVERTDSGFVLVAERVDGNLRFPVVVEGGVIEVTAEGFSSWAPGPFVLQFE